MDRDVKMNEGVEYAKSITGWMREQELQWLSEKAASLKPGSVWLEVGSWMGRSLACVALSLPADCTVIAVDTFEGELEIPLQYVKEHGSVKPIFMENMGEVLKLRPDIKLIVIDKLSVEAAREVADKSCDVIFIDANHTKEAVKADLEAWSPKLKSDGLMCGHDISDPGVYTALQGYGHAHNPLLSGSIWWMIWW